MRKNHQVQVPLVPGTIDHRYAKELEAISRLLDSQPTVADLAAQDLAEGVDATRGAPGMTGDQVIRVGLMKP